MSDNIQSLAVGLLLLDVQEDAKLSLGNETVSVYVSKPVDLQTEEQLLNWGWEQVDDISWSYSA